MSVVVYPRRDRGESMGFGQCGEGPAVIQVHPMSLLSNETRLGCLCCTRFSKEHKIREKSLTYA